MITFPSVMSNTSPLSVRFEMKIFGGGGGRRWGQVLQQRPLIQLINISHYSN